MTQTQKLTDADLAVLCAALDLDAGPFIADGPLTHLSELEQVAHLEDARDVLAARGLAQWVSGTGLVFTTEITGLVRDAAVGGFGFEVLCATAQSSPLLKMADLAAAFSTKLKVSASLLASAMRSAVVVTRASSSAFDAALASRETSLTLSRTLAPLPALLAAPPGTNILNTSNAPRPLARPLFPLAQSSV